MASDQTFEIVSKYFVPDEFNHPDKIDDLTLLTLYRMRRLEGEHKKIIITINEDYAEAGHSPKSFHSRDGVCRAFDLVVRDAQTREPLPIFEQFLIALRYKWGGIGFYPYWNTAGLHCDTRSATRRALWWRDKDGEYNYNPFDYLGAI